MQYELLTQKLNKMDNEKILLDALNTFGNFTSVEQEFNYNQLEVIYEAMNQVLHIAPVVGQSEQLLALAQYMCEHQNNLDGKTAKDYFQDFLRQ